MTAPARETVRASAIRTLRECIADARNNLATAEMALALLDQEAARNVPAGTDPRVPEEDDGA